MHLVKTHAGVLAWFDETEQVKKYRPTDNGWTIAEILEHIALTSHFLMILIGKGADKAMYNANNLQLEEIKNEFDYDLSRIDKIGIHKSFEWIRPEHMEPKGEKTEQEVQGEIISQLIRCLNHLEKLKNGEGLLHKTMMTVHELGRINVYEYIYFLSKHAERHISQMVENKKEFEVLNK